MTLPDTAKGVDGGMFSLSSTGLCLLGVAGGRFFRGVGFVLEVLRLAGVKGVHESVFLDILN